MRELARRSGPTVGTISLIERGKSPGSPATAKALADALDVSVDDLWQWEE